MPNYFRIMISLVAIIVKFIKVNFKIVNIFDSAPIRVELLVVSSQDARKRDKK